MTFVVSNELFVEPANAETFERNFAASMRGTLPQVPGLVGARLLTPGETGRGYLSVLEFVDRDAYLRYRESRWFAAAHRWPDHAPIDRNRLTTYDTILSLEPDHPTS
jgi:heme-degrading monooxygenase HmoA